MYQTIAGNQRMTTNEAAERFPDSFIVMRMDNMDVSHRMGTVLYIGDDQNELFSLLIELDDPTLCGVSEGLNRRCSLGGIVVGG